MPKKTTSKKTASKRPGHLTVRRLRFHMSLAAAVVMAVVLLGVLVVVTGRAASTMTGPSVPANNIMLGMMAGATSIANREATLGRTMAINHKFYAWTDFFFSTQYSGWPADDDAKGRMRLVTWEPKDVSFGSIISGAQDANIINHAKEAKAYGKPFFLRFAHEMNGTWFTWGKGKVSASDYVKAWQHIRDVFRAQGVTNAIFTWCPNEGSSAAEFKSYYPGDGYVDWTCLDLYSQQQYGSASFASMMNTFYATFPNKPMIIGETSVDEPGGSTKANWINTMRADLKSKFPNIKAVVWFDINKEKDWRIDSSAGTLAAWKAMASDPYFSAMRDQTATAAPTVTPTLTRTPTPTSTPVTTKRGDLNRDGKVNVLDLSTLLSNWGKAGGDVDGNGTTNVLDLSALLSNWTG